jgi:hypothetical protein
VAKHTPGPWGMWGEKVYAGKPKERRRGFLRGHKGMVCEMDQTDFPSREGKANQRLISTAPDLLQACHGGEGAMPDTFAENLDFTASYIEKSGLKFGVFSAVTMGALLRGYAKTLRAATAKAEGRKQSAPVSEAKIHEVVHGNWSRPDPCPSCKKPLRECRCWS